MLLWVLIAATVALVSPGQALGARLYVAVGDGVGEGYGSTLGGQNYFDLYCAYLQSAMGGSRVDQCKNESLIGLTSQSALDGGTIQRAVNDIRRSSDTPVVTVVLGGTDLVLAPACQSITGPSCPFIHNMRTILDQLETALASHPGPHVIQWLEYYNAKHDNPHGDASADRSTAVQLLGNDFALTGCPSHDLSLIGLNDVINCIAQEKGATPVDAYTLLQANCTSNDCFSDQWYPNDKGYGLIFDAFRDTPRSPIPTVPPADRSWPFATFPPPIRPVMSGLIEFRKVFAPSSPRNDLATEFDFWLNLPAHVTVAIERRVLGRRFGGRCRQAMWSLLHNARCTRTIHIAALRYHSHAGLNLIAFSGHVRGRVLKPGRYLAVFTATNRAGTSAPQTLQFTIIKD
ncbi:MAG: hypothetical protein QOG59_1760 [Solirubrobacteraceae bacterium]|nr:hypothetical protein [Solirubrobacteraceae bacterium]